MTSQVAVVKDLAEQRAAAFIRRGQRAWTEIKKTVEEQRTLWLEVGVALMYGKQQHPSNQAFGAWCKEMGFDMSAGTRSDAMWFAEHGSSYDGCKTESHPTRIRQTWREQQAAQALPEDLQTVAPAQTLTLEKRDAERVAKTALRAESGDEGADIAQKHLSALAKRHGTTEGSLKEAAKVGAPDTYFRIPPHQLEQIDEMRDSIRESIQAMRDDGIPPAAIKAIFLNLVQDL